MASTRAMNEDFQTVGTNKTKLDGDDGIVANQDNYAYRRTRRKSKRYNYYSHKGRGIISISITNVQRLMHDTRAK
jgi:hypothetical protein